MMSPSLSPTHISCVADFPQFNLYELMPVQHTEHFIQPEVMVKVQLSGCPVSLSNYRLSQHLLAY